MENSTEKSGVLTDRNLLAVLDIVGKLFGEHVLFKLAIAVKSDQRGKLTYRQPIEAPLL